LEKHRRHRYWVILVWVIIGFFLFPLTPPISQNITFQENALSQFNETPAFVRVKPETSDFTVPLLYPIDSWYAEDEEPDPCFPFLYALFGVFLFSKLRELLRKRLLAPLKFTSAYVASRSFDSCTL